jgi:hypothetical protein
MKQCYFCERAHEYPTLIVDTHHKLRTMFGGTNHTHNLIKLCRQCHRIFELLCNDGLPFSLHYRNWNIDPIKYRPIKLKAITYYRLSKIAKYGQTMDDIIRELLDIAESKKK